MGNRIRREGLDAGCLAGSSAGDPASAWASPAARWAAVAFPVVLWAFATCYFGGDLGKWMDDYRNSVRSPVTGEWNWYDVFVQVKSFGVFYRPLAHLLVVAKATVFWNDFWVNTLANVATHGVASFLLWRLLLGLGCQWHAAATGAMLFLVCPIGHQAVLCSSGQATTLATVFFLLLAMIYCGYARGMIGRASIGLMMVLAYLIPACQEQPATSIVLLPLLYLVARRSGDRSQYDYLRSLSPIAACGLALAVYVVLWQAGDFDSTEAKGGPKSWVTFLELSAKLEKLFAQIVAAFRMKTILSGGLAHGWTVLSNGGGCVWAGLLGLSGLFWCRDWLGRPLGRVETDAAGRNDLACLAFAFSGFVLAWLPLILQRHAVVESRLCYYPSLLLAIMVAVTIDVAARAGGNSLWWGYLFKCFVGLALVVSLCCLSICFIGIQSAYREQYHFDQRAMAQLVDKIPSPPPDTVFVPLSINACAIETGDRVFDRMILGGLEFPWVAPHMVQQAYRRRDLLMTACNRWLALPIRVDDVNSFQYTRADLLFRRHLKRGREEPVSVPWASVLPFVVNDSMEIEIVTGIIVDRGGRNDLRIDRKQLSPVLADQRWRETSFILTETLWKETIQSIQAWHWESTGKPVLFAEMECFKLRRQAIAMHPRYPGNPNTGSMRATIPASPKPSRLYFQAAFPEWSLRDRPWGDGIEVVIYLEGQRDAPLGSLLVTPKQVDSEKRWIPISVEVPPLGEPRTLYLEVRPGPAGNVDYDLCYVTSGFREYLAAPDAASAPSTSTGE